MGLRVNKGVRKLRKVKYVLLPDVCIIAFVVGSADPVIAAVPVACPFLVLLETLVLRLLSGRTPKELALV